MTARERVVPAISDAGAYFICLNRSGSGGFIHIAMITAANTPQTTTKVLMICFSSETDIASDGRRCVKHKGSSIERYKTCLRYCPRVQGNLIAWQFGFANWESGN